MINKDCDSIAPPPAVVDPETKKRCRFDLLEFQVTYFPNVQPFDGGFFDAVKTTERAVMDGGQYINEMDQGAGKTYLCETAALWATLYGHRQYVAIILADQWAASKSIRNIKKSLVKNELLAQDFPEVCHPAKALEEKRQRCQAQAIDGRLTRIKWDIDKLVFPTVTIDGKQTECSGAIIHARGLMGSLRGMILKRPGQWVRRPDLALIDDPQTAESAASVAQTRNRLEIIRRDLPRLGGRQEPTPAAVVNATKLRDGDLVDQLLDPEKSPGWKAGWPGS